MCYRSKGRAWRYKNRLNEEYIRKNRERSAKNRRLRALLKIRDGKSFVEQLKQNDLYIRVDTLVPQALNPEIRGDVIQSTILAVLEGKIALADDGVKLAIKGFISSEYRSYDLASKFSGKKSLNDLAFRDGNATLHDVENSNIWDM